MNNQPLQGTADYNEGYANGYAHDLSKSKSISYADWKHMQENHDQLIQYREYMAGWKQGWVDRDTDDRNADREAWYAKCAKAGAEWESWSDLPTTGKHPYAPDMPDDASEALSVILQTPVGPVLPKD